MKILVDVSYPTRFPSISLRHVVRTIAGRNELADQWTLTAHDCIHVTYRNKQDALNDLASVAAAYGCLTDFDQCVRCLADTRDCICL